MDKNTIKTIRREMETALGEISKRHGLSFSIGTIRFTDDSFRAKVEATKLKAGETVVSTSRFPSQFKQFAGASVRYMGEGYKIIDYNSNRPKFPVSVERIRDGRRFKMTTSIFSTAQISK